MWSWAGSHWIFSLSLRQLWICKSILRKKQKAGSSMLTSFKLCGLLYSKRKGNLKFTIKAVTLLVSWSSQTMKMKSVTRNLRIRNLGDTHPQGTEWVSRRRWKTSSICRQSWQVYCKEVKSYFTGNVLNMRKIGAARNGLYGQLKTETVSPQGNRPSDESCRHLGVSVGFLLAR